MPTKVKRERSSIVKSFDDGERFERELCLLRFLESSDLSSLTPKIMDIDCANFVLKMSIIEGTTPADNDINFALASDLGKSMGLIHALAKFDRYGAFDSELQVKNGETSFSSFLISRIEKWHQRLNAMSVTLDGVEALQRRVREREDEWDRFSPPSFSHNDFDLKNIIVLNGRVSGLIDWEFAGAYSSAWEIRKIISHNFWRNVELRGAFIGGFSQIHEHVSLPDASETKILEAIDCMVALGWAQRNADTYKVEYLKRLFTSLLREIA